MNEAGERYIVSKGPEAERVLLAQQAIDDFLARGTTPGIKRDAVLRLIDTQLKETEADAPSPFAPLLFPHNSRIEEIIGKPQAEASLDELAFVQRYQSLKFFNKKLQESKGDQSARDALHAELVELMPKEKSAGRQRRDEARRLRQKQQK